jgi:nickel/cobalt transporter (NicO) family protein
VQRATRRLNLSDRLLRRLPLASATLVALIGLVMLWDGLIDLRSIAA